MGRSRLFYLHRVVHVRGQGSFIYQIRVQLPYLTIRVLCRPYLPDRGFPDSGQSFIYSFWVGAVYFITYAGLSDFAAVSPDTVSIIS